MAETNHECIICGANYLACDDCDKYHFWKAVCDVWEHYELYMVIHRYNNKRITVTEAYDELIRLGITKYNIQDYKIGVQNIINNILSVDSSNYNTKIESAVESQIETNDEISTSVDSYSVRKRKK